ncbi:MAG: CBS domain-containing protein, partial [Desulfovibrio sp.]|nr:CBS domain-containing protein [Desulfovibrio sp.]
DALLGAGVPDAVFDQPAGAVMTKGMVAVDVQTTLGQMLELMQARGISRLPVTEDNHLIGIVSRTDILNFFLRQR